MPRLVLFHGLPGGETDAQLAFGDAALSVDVVAVGKTPDTSCTHHIVAFSAGSHRALEFAARHPGAVARVTLIAPAAPLSLGGFLPDLAGEPVFRAALSSRAKLARLTRAQATLLKIAPGLLMGALFRGVAEAERQCVTSPETRAIILEGLRSSLLDNRESYLDGVMDYVSATHDGYAKIAAPVAIRFGTADSWAPPAMAAALADCLPNATLHPYEGLGHYSTLVAAGRSFQPV